jgi:hypothetical protein
MMNGLGLGVMLQQQQRRRLTGMLTAVLTVGLAAGRLAGRGAGAAACLQEGVRSRTSIMLLLLLLRRAAGGQLTVTRRIGRKLRRSEAGSAVGMQGVLQGPGNLAGPAAGRLRQVMAVPA